jgi:hypothetical protein
MVRPSSDVSFDCLVQVLACPQITEGANSHQRQEPSEISCLSQLFISSPPGERNLAHELWLNPLNLLWDFGGFSTGDSSMKSGFSRSGTDITTKYQSLALRPKPLVDAQCSGVRSGSSPDNE